MAIRKTKRSPQNRENLKLELYNAVSEEYEISETSENKSKVDTWVTELSGDAAFNFESYANCFISENLLRKYIHEKDFSVCDRVQKEIDKFKGQEIKHKQKANINIDIRKNRDDLSFLDMSHLKQKFTKPIRMVFRIRFGMMLKSTNR